MDRREFFVLVNNERKGPYSLPELKKLILSGLIPSFVKVYDTENNRQRIIGQDPDFSSFFEIYEEKIKKTTVQKIQNISKRNGDTNREPERDKDRESLHTDLKKIDEQESPSFLDQTVISNDFREALEDESKRVNESTREDTSDYSIEDFQENEHDYAVQEIEENPVQSREQELTKTFYYPTVDREKREKQKSERQKKKLSRSQRKKNIASKSDSTKKGLNPRFLAIGFALILAILMFDEGGPKKKIGGLKEPEFSLPKKAEWAKDDDRKKILKSSEFKDLKSQVTSVFNYQENLEYSQKIINYFEKNNLTTDLAYYLIISYSLQIPHSLNQSTDTAKVYQLIKIFNRPNSLNQLSYNEARAVFFNQIKKFSATKFIVEKYLALDKQISVFILTLYLEALVELGEFEMAQEVINRLGKENRNIYYYQVVLNYLKVENKFKDYERIIKEAIKDFPNSVPILLKYCEYATLKRDYELLESILDRIQKLKYETSYFYYSQYLNYQGILDSLQNRPKQAFKNFEKSLEYFESKDLRSRLAEIQFSSENDEVERFMQKNRALHLIHQSQTELKKKNWKEAFRLAIEASDIAPNSLETKIALAKIQIKYGYHREVEKSLSQLMKKYPENSDLYLIRLENAIFSFNDQLVKDLILIFKNYNLKSNAHYYFLVSEYQRLNKNYNDAAIQLLKALSLDQLNDRYLGNLAQLYLESKDFVAARKLISRAINFDPSEVKHRIVYANILYEEESTDVAIGYLRKLKEDFLQNFEVDNEIAKFYYRSGQARLFNDLRKQLKEKSQETQGFRYFMMKNNFENEKWERVITDGLNYIQDDPGSIPVRMLLAEAYYRSDKTREAVKALDQIRERLPTYPGLEVLRGRILKFQGKVEEAVEAFQQEIKNHPQSPRAHFRMADLYVQLENFVSAENHYKLAMRYGGDESEAQVGLAYINYQNGRLDAALSLYLKALEIRSDDPDLYLQLGDVYKELGRIRQAVEMYETYLELNPDASNAGKIKQFINNSK